MNEIEIHIQDDFGRRSTEIFIYMKNEATGKMLKAKKMDLVFGEMLEGEYIEPSLIFKYGEGQEFLHKLAQALITSGYRDKAISKDGEIKRMTDHLEDMRKIAFKFIDEREL